MWKSFRAEIGLQSVVKGENTLAAAVATSILDVVTWTVAVIQRWRSFRADIVRIHSRGGGCNRRRRCGYHSGCGGLNGGDHDGDDANMTK